MRLAAPLNLKRFYNKTPGTKDLSCPEMTGNVQNCLGFFKSNLWYAESLQLGAHLLH